MNFKKSPIGISITALLLSLFLAPLSQAEFLINEFLADNSGAGLTDEEGFPADWIEIHNPGAAASIAGYTLSDDPSNLTKWTLPDVVIPANGYLVIFATGKDRAIAGSELHTNFSLEASGDYPPAIRQIVTTSVDPNGRFTLSFPKNLAADDALIIVELSSDLKTWTPAGETLELGSETHNGDGTSTFTLRTPEAAADAAKLFVRLRVYER